MLRVALVGLGVIAPYYLAALAESSALRLVAVCDRDERALSPYRGRLPCFADHRDLLRHGGLDAVLVTVPNHAHAEVCRAVLAAGLPVCVEKPLTTELADAVALVRAARAGGVVLFTVFHRRYNAAVTAVARRLHTAAPIESMTVRYLERIEEHIGADRWYLDPARCGGGCVADNGPNAFDLARLLAGPLRVVGADIVRDAPGIDRQARVLLHADSGARVRVLLDWSYPGECKDVEVRLADGAVHRADLLYGYPGFKASLWHEYRAALADFARAVAAGDTGDTGDTGGAGRRGAHPAGAGDAGLAALRLVHDSYRCELLDVARGERR